MTASLQTGSNPDDATTAHEAHALAASSRFVQRLRRRYENELSLLPAGEPRRPAMAQAYATLRRRGDGVAEALRIVRQLVMERLVTLDCEQQAPLAVVTTAATRARCRLRGRRCRGQTRQAPSPRW